MLVAVQILPEAKGYMCMHGSTRLAQAMISQGSYIKGSACIASYPQKLNHKKFI